MCLLRLRLTCSCLLLVWALACQTGTEPFPGDVGSGGWSAGGTAEHGSGSVDGAAVGGGSSSGGTGEAPPGVGGGEAGSGGSVGQTSPRVRASFDDHWRFTRGDPAGAPDLSYAATKAWVLPSGNTVLPDPADHAPLPSENLADGLAYLELEFDDSSWQAVTLPHDYAIAGPFTNSVSSSMGRLPSPGVAWYRKTFTLAAEDADKSVSLELDGAMQYALVWVNGHIVGGWPYGYASYRLDLTDYLAPGSENVVAVRLETPVPASSSWDAGSSRWYPGAGIYRNVWLVTTDAVHVAHWGTHITTPSVTSEAATVELAVTVENDGAAARTVTVVTDVYELDANGSPSEMPVLTLPAAQLTLPLGERAVVQSTGTLEAPRLWGVPPLGSPNLYLARTQVSAGQEVLDVYDTRFGVRSITFDGEGFSLNGARLKLEGVCLHHDLGALGAAVNRRARQRQLEILQEMGSNAIRTSHNPFEPEFYDLADEMGFLVMDEAFDVWEAGKAALDHHVFFSDWHERDLRALIRRDRNHPSVIMWSLGNEIVEQSDPIAGPALGARLTAISHEEDSTRPTVSGMNKAEPDSPFSGPFDAIGLNYQGTGVRDLGAQYPTYHLAFPDKFIVGTETTSTFSTRGTYLFPVTGSRGVPATGSSGVDAQAGIISSYDLYHADWSYSPDEEFESQDRWPYVGGEFVWTGFDYLGEPTPLDAVARSSYFGIVDLAGFKKDRFYLYQAKWRPELPMAHILPHWTWPGREGQVTPVHVYTSGDAAELFVNGVSQGRKSKGEFEYRLRWDAVVYEPGIVSVVAYLGDAEWATASVETTGAAAALSLTADRGAIVGDGVDLAFVTARVQDSQGRLVPSASHEVSFSVSGPGEIVATDSGDPTDTVVFASSVRRALSGMALAIVRALPGQTGPITVTAVASGLAPGSVTVMAEERRNR